MKTCTRCHISLPIESFGKNCSTKDGRLTICKNCNKISSRKRHIESYGISEDLYKELYSKQNGCCKLCKNESKRNLDIDHCHSSGIFRGLLCNNCNKGLGFFFDNIELMNKAITYLNDPIPLPSGGP